MTIDILNSSNGELQEAQLSQFDLVKPYSDQLFAKTVKPPKSVLPSRSKSAAGRPTVIVRP